LKIALQPEKERAMPRMAATLWALDVADRVAHLFVIQKAISHPAATGTFDARRKQSIARINNRPTPNYAQQQIRRA
jgi:hypothetical protein